MMTEDVAQAIRDYFLADRGGCKWEADDDGWLWIYEANFGFDPLELAALIKALDEPA